jgi:hypothetical protein
MRDDFLEFLFLNKYSYWITQYRRAEMNKGASTDECVSTKRLKQNPIMEQKKRNKILILVLVLVSSVSLRLQFRTTQTLLEGFQSPHTTSFPVEQKNGTRLGNDTPQGKPTKKKKGLWFLHIPKTGSTFFRSMIQHACPTQSAEEVLEIFHLLLKNKHANAFPCASSIKPGHVGLGADKEIDRVVTMVRNPFDRVVSGFLHNFHDCDSLQKRLSIHNNDDQTTSMEGICRDVKDIVHDPRPSAEDWLEKRKRTHGLVLDYMNCVGGCSRNMLLGGKRCQSPPKKVDDVDLSAMVDQRMESLAFVGVTDEWDKSMCLWRHTFPSHPRGSGDYLSDEAFGTNAQFRKSPLQNCGDDLKQMIQSDETLSTKIKSDQDWSVFKKAFYLLNERLPQQCQSESD